MGTWGVGCNLEPNKKSGPKVRIKALAPAEDTSLITMFSLKTGNRITLVFKIIETALLQGLELIWWKADHNTCRPHINISNPDSPLSGHVPSPAHCLLLFDWLPVLTRGCGSCFSTVLLTVNGHNCWRSAAAAAAAAAAPIRPCCQEGATCKQQLGVAR